jgi:hypothetical protein
MESDRSKLYAREDAGSGRGDVSPRVVILALLFLVVVAVSGFYADLLYFVSSRFGSGVPSSAPFAVLFVLAALATAGPIGRLLRFTRRELLSLYAIVLAGAPLVSHGILGYMLPHSIFQQYGARVYPDWEKTFLHLIPMWLSPTEPQAVEGFFLGGASVPWSLWWLPLAAWCSFLVALTVASVCLTLLLQRQWITNERLSFPLAQIPLEMVVQGDDSRARARLTAARVFWLGFALSFGVQFWNGLCGIFPSLPAIPLGPMPMIQRHQVGPLAGLGDMDLVLWPWLIAIAYLIPKELSFSCWFLWLVRVGFAVIAIAAGAPPRSPEGWLGDTTFPAFAFQGFGSILALSAWAIWRARRHLGRAIRIALSRESGHADADEPIPYRWMLIGLVLSFGWLIYFCWLAGCRVVVGIGLIGVILTFYLAWTWLRAETGLGLLLFPAFPDDIIDAFGNSIYRPREIVMIMSARWTYFNGAGSSLHIVAGNVLESLKIADSARVRPQPLLRAMSVGFLLSLVVGVYVTLTGMYHYGFYGLRSATSTFWLGSQVRWGAGHIFYALTDPSKLDINAILGTGAGAAVAIALGMLRLRFWWWPLHPVGYLAANSWGMHWFYSAFLIGWIAKSLVTRYGGLRLYRQTVPIAIGLIGGELTNEVVWVVIRILGHGSI